MKNIAILGSTGSIGTQTLDVADITNEYKISALTAHRNVSLMEEQIRKYKPSVACMTDENAAKDLNMFVIQQLYLFDKNYTECITTFCTSTKYF